MDDLLRELSPFVLSDVQHTGTIVGVGSYSSVEEVSVPVDAAAKTVHGYLPDDRESATQFLREMSTIRHPNIVQFLGVCYSSDSPVPALVMERMLTNLHSLLMLQLDPQSPPSEAGNSTPLALSLASKISILHDVASGLAYLHEQSPPIIHRNLSARNVLLNSAMVAKIADLLRTNSLSRARPSAEASVYMPSDAEEGTSTDIFSFGVIALFTFGEVFPCDLEPASYYDESMVPRTERERRSKYMDNLETKLHASRHLFKTSFFTRNYKYLTMLVEKCLDSINPRWPKHIHESLVRLDTARCRIKIDDSERNKRELLQALQTQPRHQNLEQVFKDLVTENVDLKSQIAQKEDQLVSSERDLARARQQIRDMEEQLKTSMTGLNRFHAAAGR